MSLDRPERLEPLALPSPTQWADLGLTVLEEIRAGHQSRVFRVTRGAEQLVAKLTDGRMADPAHRLRVELVAKLAAVEESVVGPVLLLDDLVQPIGDWWITCTPHVQGEMPDIGNPRHVEAMGTALAKLHDSLAGWEDCALPPVSGLRHDDGAAIGPRQLIHGDFADANLLLVDDDVKLLDFDECGYGSIEFELGNSLYMVVFDATMAGDPARYHRFRTRLVAAYRTASSAVVRDDAIDGSIRIRIAALQHWLDDLGGAPIGIRTATPEWQEELRRFVRQVSTDWWADR